VRRARSTRKTADTDLGRRFAAAAPLSPAGFFPHSDHQLTTAAQIARNKFLATELGLSG
jgi:hypothetical protein